MGLLSIPLPFSPRPRRRQATPVRCPTCERTFPEDIGFCPHDGARLVSSETAAYPLDPLLGALLDGRFRLETVIGAGGFGVVYRARQVNVDREVAVKVLTADASQNQEIVRRFENEAKIISQLRHPNTLKLVDFGRAPDGRLYIVTEFLTGLPLDKVLAAGRIDCLRTLRMMAQVCDSLTEAHEQGIVHRDLKPGNIFLERVGQQEVVKVLDFGIAKLTAQTTHTATGRIFGTPAYMSPEQARGDEIDARSDLYSLGVVAYECLSGMPPFTGSNPMSILLKHLQEPPLPLGERAPPLGLDPEVDALVLAMLSKLADDRPSSASEVRAAIHALEHRLGARPERTTLVPRGNAMSGAPRPSAGSLPPTTPAEAIRPAAPLPIPEVGFAATEAGPPVTPLQAPPVSPPPSPPPVTLDVPKRPLWPVIAGLTALLTAAALFLAFRSPLSAAPGTTTAVAAPPPTPAEAAPSAMALPPTAAPALATATPATTAPPTPTPITAAPSQPHSSSANAVGPRPVPKPVVAAAPTAAPTAALRVIPPPASQPPPEPAPATKAPPARRPGFFETTFDGQ